MKFEEVSFEEIVKYLFLGLTVVGIIFALRYTFTHITEPRMVNLILVLPFVFFLTPYLILSLYQIKRVDSKMQVVPRFLRDVVDNVDSGMDLVSSIKATGNNEYGVLNLDIRKFVNQLSWGVDFDIALTNFAKNIGSRDLKRDFLLVMEARRVGGHVDKILRELSLKIGVENLRKKERRSNLASNTFTGYISFVIFVFIIVIVYNNLFVGLTDSMNGGQEAQSLVVDQESGLPISAEPVEQPKELSIYLTLLILLSYELALLSGFLFGLMQDNNIIAGAPHVVLLMMITFTGFFFFINWAG
ncbi:MAG: type II secretion system F family protein [Nanoarchaeota archaeon]